MIIAELIKRGATVSAYDPVAMQESERIFGDEPGLSYAGRPKSALEGADALVIVTEWKEFRSPGFRVDQGAPQAARGVRRSQHVRPRGDARGGHRVLRDRQGLKAGRARGLIRLRQPGQPRARNRIAPCALADLEQRTLRPGRRPPCRVVAAARREPPAPSVAVGDGLMAPAVRLQ